MNIMQKIRSNFVWMRSGCINLNESMWEMPKSCCVKNESHQNSVNIWKSFSYFVYNTPWNPLFCDLQTVSINLMGHMYLSTHFCSFRGLENEINGNWAIFWRPNTGVEPYRDIIFFQFLANFWPKRPPPPFKIDKIVFLSIYCMFFGISPHFQTFFHDLRWHSLLRLYLLFLAKNEILAKMKNFAQNWPKTWYRQLEKSYSMVKDNIKVLENMHFSLKSE